MDALPNEVLHNIFIQLELEERIKCTLVCHKWWRVLDNYTLAYDIEIKQNQDRFNRFVEMIKQCPHRASQVKILRLMSSLGVDFNKRLLITMFPNVRLLKVEWNGKFTQAQEYHYFSEPIEMAPSKSSVRKLSDSVYCELISQMLTFNLCGVLEYLELNFASVHDVSNSTILDQLQNIPTLETLRCLGARIGMTDLEKLHQNLPNIQVLWLQCVITAAGEMPNNIEPVTALSFFTIDISYVENHDVETHIQFYLYMIQKYKNVTRIWHKNDCGMLDYPPDDAKRVYLNGILGFYRIMRPYGNKLEIELVPDDVDIFEVLDEMDWKLEELLISLCQGRTLFQYLAQSNQSKTIRKLTLDDTEIGTPHSLRSMTALTTLDMEFPSEDLQAIDLTDYLNGCPATLKRFSINHAYLEMNPSLTSVNHIETLIIKGCEITKDLGAIISTCFPNLIRLTLSGVLLENVDILLYSHSVTFASFDIGKTGSYGCVFKSQGQVGAHHYEYSKIQKLSLFESVSILPKLTVSYFT